MAELQKETLKQQKKEQQSLSHSSQKDQNRQHSSHSQSSSLSSQAELVEEGEGKQKKLVRYKYVNIYQPQCCKICKHPDKSKKACVCVVPLSQRRADLGDGCRNCGCMGCSKEDYISKGQDPQYHPQPKDAKALAKKSQAKKLEKRQRQRERSRSPVKKKSSPRRKARKASRSRSHSPQIIDTYSLKFHNFDRSIIGNVLVNDFQVNPNLLGFAIPQRTYSYIFGKPR